MIVKRLLDSWYRRPRVGVALSGGGARGLAHIGVLKTLERANIPIDVLAGTSMGGAIAAGYATGLDAAALQEHARKLSNVRMALRLLDWAVPGSGSLLHGKRLLSYLEDYLQQYTFDDLKIPLAVVAVDLNSGQEVVLQQGSVALAVRATVSVPGLFPPVGLDGKRLVDGGLLNNLPADVARQMGAEVVIAVDVSSKIGDASDWESLAHQRLVPRGVLEIMSTLAEALAILTTPQQERKLAEARPDVLIRPPVPPDVTLLTGYTRADELIAIGEQAAEAALPQLESRLQPRFHLRQNFLDTLRKG